MTNATPRKIVYQPHTEVYLTESGHVAIQQAQELGEDDAIVVIDPLFLPAIIAWMQEAASGATADYSGEYSPE